MLPPSTAEDENIFTASARRFFKELQKDFEEKMQIQRWINYTLALICFCCILCCGFGVKAWWKFGNDLESFLAHQTAATNRQSQLAEEKARRDSIAYTIYINEMKHYRKMPYYKEK
jgi:hypothetical protein